MSKTIKTKAAKLASVGSTLAFVAIVLGGPILGIPAVILGIKAFRAMTPEESFQSMSNTKDQAITAIVGGLLVSLGWIGYFIYKLSSR